MITGIEHIAIASFDPRQLSNWYIQYMSCTLIVDTGKTVYLKAPNGVVLEFVYADTKPSAPRIRDAGLRHIAFGVDNLEAAVDELKAVDIKVENEHVIIPGARLHFFQDLEGNFLHFVEREVPFFKRN